MSRSGQRSGVTRAWFWRVLMGWCPFQYSRQTQLGHHWSHAHQVLVVVSLVVRQVLLLCVCAQTSAACQRRCRGSSTGQLSSSSSARATRGQLSGISSSRGGSAAALRGQVGGAALQQQCGLCPTRRKKIPWLRPTIVTLVDWVNTQGPGVWGVSLLQLQAGVLGGRAACVVD